MSYTQLDSRLSSLKDFNKIKDAHLQLEEEFNRQENFKQKQENLNSEYNLILQDLRNQNSYKQKFLKKLDIKPISSIVNQINDKKQQTLSTFDQSQSIQSVETNKQLQLHIDELVKSINKKKQQIYPMEHQMQLLNYQQKQAQDELILAEFEMLRAKQLLQSMKMQIERLQNKRNQYLQELMDKNDVQKCITDENKREYQIIAEQINLLKSQIQEQKQQLEDLKHQEQLKWESSGNQMIIIKNYLAMTKLYEYCNNEIQNIDISQDIDDESEDIIVESPDNSLIEEGGIFQTQIRQTSLKSKQSIRSIGSIKKNQKNKINYQQSLQNFISAKELIAQVKQDVEISIIEEIILKFFEEQTCLQRQLAEQHTLLLEQKSECYKELNSLSNQEYDDNKERLIQCQKPQNDNFNSDFITTNIAQNSITNKLKIIQTISRRQQMEDMFLCINNRAIIFLQRIINILHNMAQRSDMLNTDIINKYQHAQMTITLINKQQNQLNLDDYPQFKQQLKSNILTQLYCDQILFLQYKLYCKQIVDQDIDDQILLDNFDALLQLCLNKIASESQCIYEQIALIFSTIKYEMHHLNQHCHITIKEQSQLPHLVQMTYNQTAEKLQNYTDYKISDPNIKKKQFQRRSMLTDEIIQNYQEDDEDKYYQKIKTEIENPQLKRDTQQDSTMIGKTTLLYDNSTPRTDYIKQNRQISQSLNRIQSLSHIYQQYGNQDFNTLKLNINKEQKTIQYLTNHSTQSRPDSYTYTTYRQDCKTEHTIPQKLMKSKSQMPKVVLSEAKKQLQKIRTINKLQFK